MNSLEYQTSLMNYKISNELYNALEIATEVQLMTGKSKWDYSSALAGRITHGAQVLLPAPQIETSCKSVMHDVYSHLTNLARHYFKHARMDTAARSFWTQENIEVDDVWCVSQYAYDYNPLHGHDGILSGVIYLRVPECISNESNDQGCLYFHQSNPWNECINETLWRGHQGDFSTTRTINNSSTEKKKAVYIRPAIGECWLFPSWLLHEVKPFQGPGERRSVAFNIRPCTNNNEIKRSAANTKFANSFDQWHLETLF